MSEAEIIADIVKLAIGGAVGALSGLVTGWFTGRRAARAALDDWERKRRDSADELAVQAIRELATEAARGTHFACWLTRKAKYDCDRVQDADIDRYYSEMHECLPKLFGAQAALVTINANSYDAVSMASTKVAELDAAVARACVEWRNGDKLALGELYDQTLKVHDSVTQHIRNSSSDILRGSGSDRELSHV